jgi:hypothetical protein
MDCIFPLGKSPDSAHEKKTYMTEKLGQSLNLKRGIDKVDFNALSDQFHWGWSRNLFIFILRGSFNQVEKPLIVATTYCLQCSHFAQTKTPADWVE